MGLIQGWKEALQKQLRQLKQKNPTPGQRIGQEKAAKMHFVNARVTEEERQRILDMKVPNPAIVTYPPRQSVLDPTRFTIDRESGTFLALGGCNREEPEENYFVLYYEEHVAAIRLTKDFPGNNRLVWSKPGMWCFEANAPLEEREEEVWEIVKAALRVRKIFGDPNWAKEDLPYSVEFTF